MVDHGLDVRPGGRLACRPFSLEVLGKPGEIPLVEILDVGRRRDAVILAGIDHQLGGLPRQPRVETRQPKPSYHSMNSVFTV